MLVLAGAALVGPELLAGPLGPLTRALSIAIVGILFGNAYRQLRGEKGSRRHRQIGTTLSAAIFGSVVLGVPLVVSAVAGFVLGALLLRPEPMVGGLVDSVGVLEILLLVLFSALFSFGGGSGQIPLIQGRWVETGQLAPELFSFSLAITYLSPGPRAGFLAGVGYYLAGLPGAAVAMFGILVPTVLGAAAVSYALGRMQRILRRLQPSSGFVIAG